MVCQSRDWASRSISFFHSLLDSCLNHENNPGPACWMGENNLGLRKVVSDKAYKTSQSLDFFFFFSFFGPGNSVCSVLRTLGLHCWGLGSITGQGRPKKKKKKNQSPAELDLGLGS